MKIPGKFLQIAEGGEYHTRHPRQRGLVVEMRLKSGVRITRRELLLESVHVWYSL
jgi:hypothetical protein